MRILLDECVNAGIREAFPKHAVRTVAEMGWQSRKDSELLTGFVIARARSNLIAEFLPIFERLREAADRVKPGEIVHVSALSP